MQIIIVFYKFLGKVIKFIKIFYFKLVMPWHMTKAFACMINRHFALLDRFAILPYVTSSTTTK